MKKNCKYLPPLNQLFLQRQSFSSHRRKMNEIYSNQTKIAPSSPCNGSELPAKPNCISIMESFTFSASRKPQAKRSYSVPEVIKERNTPQHSARKWMSPFQKRQQSELLKQNQRLYDRINTSKSEFKQQKLIKNYLKFSHIKKRIMKFELNPECDRPLLKSEKSLDLLSRRLPLTASKAKIPSEVNKAPGKQLGLGSQENSEGRQEVRKNLRASLNLNKKNKLELNTKRIEKYLHQSSVKLVTQPGAEGAGDLTEQGGQQFALTQIDI